MAKAMIRGAGLAEPELLRYVRKHDLAEVKISYRPGAGFSAAAFPGPRMQEQLVKRHMQAIADAAVAQGVAFEMNPQLSSLVYCEAADRPVALGSGASLHDAILDLVSRKPKV